MNDEIKKYQVLMAEPFRYNALGSFGNAEYMLLRQHNFPLEYYSNEKLHQADHDRMLMWDYEGFSRICREYFNSGELGIESFAQKASVEKIMSFLKDAFKADPLITWTGFRIMGTVNRSNGYPVFTLELFAKNPESDTKVYSGSSGANVKPMNKKMTKNGINWVFFGKE